MSSSSLRPLTIATAGCGRSNEIRARLKAKVQIYKS